VDQLGSYRLRKRLAVGGMGEVYLGEKIGPEGFVKPVVLKCVLPQLARDRAFVQLFLDEARLAALLNHPNIAQVYDFGLVDDIYYIAMEYVPGYTVDDIRRKLRDRSRQFMPLEHIACIASQVCQGLHYAHTLTDANGVSLGLVHRDVSPHNLIVSIDGSVKIVDFGIAKARAGLTRVQAKGAVGKFGYMSPEQSRGEQVDAPQRRLLARRVPVGARDQRAAPRSQARSGARTTRPSARSRRVTEFRREVPRQFEQILDDGLGHRPEDRYRRARRCTWPRALPGGDDPLRRAGGPGGYIKDLVEGKVENPESGHTGSVVEPARRGAASRAPAPAGQDNMDGAQKYEEVFGVTMASKRPRTNMRAVPKSWETAEAPSRPSPPPKAERPGPRMVDLSGGRAAEPEIPDLAADMPRRGPGAKATPLPTPKGGPRRPPAPRRPWCWGRWWWCWGASGRRATCTGTRWWAWWRSSRIRSRGPGASSPPR
jgi:hypothetical protein